jgi:hypothetical protein
MRSKKMQLFRLLHKRTIKFGIQDAPSGKIPKKANREL